MARYSSGQTHSPFRVCIPRHFRTVYVVFGVLMLLVLAAAHIWDDSLGRSNVNTKHFDGKYTIIADASFVYDRNELAADEQKAASAKAAGEPVDPQLAFKISNLRELIPLNLEQYANFTIKNGVIRSGNGLVQEFALSGAIESDGELFGTAIWHEDIHDSGDCQSIGVHLKLAGNRLTFRIGDEENGYMEPVVLERVASKR